MGKEGHFGQHRVSFPGGSERWDDANNATNDQLERLRGGIDLIADERNRLAKRVAALESYMRLIMHRCNIPAKPGQVCHENPAEIARQALGGAE